MLVSAEGATIELNKKDMQRLALISCTTDEAEIVKAAATSIQHVMAICSPNHKEDPIMMDMDVFIAQKILETQGVPIDKTCVQVLLEAWTRAEQQLRPDARIALRLLEGITKTVLAAKSKTDFNEKFEARFLTRMPGKSKQFVRSFIEVMLSWAEGQSKPQTNRHYLENVVGGIYEETIGKTCLEKDMGFCQKRLCAVKDALDAYLFD